MQLKAPLLAAIVLALAASTASAAPAPKSKDNAGNLPMVFYLAKGDPDSCGEGCGEWIAAEGQFDAGAAQRLVALLTKLGKRKLPIYFHSPGGNGTAALEMGRQLRRREMTAGVYKTVPVGCLGASEQACRSLKQSGQVLPSTLQNLAGCSSACVFALIGATVRQVPPGAHVGVHSAKLTFFRPDGRKVDYSDKRVMAYHKRRMAELNAQYRRYVQEMKVDARLFDLAVSVPNESIHYLSRDEIVTFGIDARGAPESRWVATELLPEKLWVMKFFVERRGAGGKELRTNVIRMECAGPQRARIAYYRGLGPDETATKKAIELAIDERKIGLSRSVSTFKVEAIEAGTSFEMWTGSLALDDLEAAGTRDYVDIVEADSAGASPHTTRLSVAGLSQAVSALHGRCAGLPDCPQVISQSPLPGGTGAQQGWASGALLPNTGGTSANWDALTPNCVKPVFVR